MKTLLKYKTTILVILLFVLAMYVYNTFFYSTALETAGGETATQIGDDLLSTYEELQSITLESSLFSSPGYLGLVDFSVTVPQQSIGRPNPFNDIGRD